MSISTHQLLAKMEEELNGAKASQTDATMRERVYAIKSLCELVLGQDRQAQETPMFKPLQQTSYPVTPIPMSVQPQPIQTTQTNKIDTDEGNGDSLFDF